VIPAAPGGDYITLRREYLNHRVGVVNVRLHTLRRKNLTGDVTLFVSIKGPALCDSQD